MALEIEVPLPPQGKRNIIGIVHHALVHFIIDKL